MKDTFLEIMKNADKRQLEAKRQRSARPSPKDAKKEAVRAALWGLIAPQHHEARGHPSAIAESWPGRCRGILQQYTE